MWDVSGVTGAAPVWQEVMQYLHAGDAGAAPAMPSGVVRQDIVYRPQIEAARTELFLPGTEQGVVTLARSADAKAAIRYPTAGLIVALDPDIPPSRQHVRFAAQGVAAGKGSWRLDGKAIGMPLRHSVRGAAGADLSVLWQPWPGRHRLELLDAAGKTLDQVAFEVRGAEVKRKVN